MTRVFYMKQMEINDISILLRGKFKEDIITEIINSFFGKVDLFDKSAREEYYIKYDKSGGYLEIDHVELSYWDYEISGEINFDYFFPDHGGTDELQVLNIALSISLKLETDVMIGNNLTEVGEFLMISKGKISEYFDSEINGSIL